MKQSGDFSAVIHLFPCGEPFQQTSCALTLNVLYHAAQLDVGSLQHLLKPIQLPAALLADTFAVTGQFPQFPLTACS